MCLKPLTPFRDLKKGLLRMQQPLLNSLAGVLGFEPRSTVLETVALPLNYSPSLLTHL